MSYDTKDCPICGENIKAVAIKCRFCNTDLVTHAASKEDELEKVLFKGHPEIIYNAMQWVAVALTLGIAYLFYWLESISTTYEITTQRVKIEKGILSKSKENVELFRIDHFDLHKPLGMRIVGQCLLHLRSTDPSFPSIKILAIPNLESLAENLRECSLRERTRRRVTTFVHA